MKKSLHIFYSGITDRYYATRSYRLDGNGIVTITGQKDDVTDEIEAIIRERLRQHRHRGALVQR